jgi:hypothetical protein
MEDDILKCHSNLQDFAFRAGLMRVKTLSTWNLVRKHGPAWAHAIHLESKNYSTIAVAVVPRAEEIHARRPVPTNAIVL